MIDPATFDAAVAAAKIPGAVGMIVDPDGVRFARAVGEADATSHVPMREDTLFQIASMTKAVTSVAAMQLVEQGRLSLDADIGAVLPDLANPQVMMGTGPDGKPQLRAAKGPITLRHLLTHTAGLGYFFIHPEVLGYYMATGMPAPGSLDSIRMPLMFDPGESWEYSVATDWVGQAVEAVTGQKLGDYFAEHVTGPLGMSKTAFRPEMPADAAKVHVRAPDGGWTINPAVLGGGEFQMGGGGLSCTAGDYALFVRMLLRGGELDGIRLLQAETIAEMTRDQVAPLRAGKMGSAMPELAGPYDTFPDQHTGWGLGFLINPAQGPHGRSPGSLAWAGIFNSFYWFDPVKRLGGVFMSQMAPFGDPGALAAFGALEEMAYA
ncbi:MAG: serine hydrolase domain-containing protein [Novosphingobium sp.]